MDKMHINGLSFMCIIGTKPEERKKKQKVVIDVGLECELKKAGRSDKLADTVNYKKLADEIASLVRSSKFFLIEKLAETIARVCLNDSKVKGVMVRVTKPGALEMAHSASVEICRRRGVK